MTPTAADIAQASPMPHRILLGVDGGCVGSEIVELARGLVASGAAVQVVLTAAAEPRVSAAALAEITGQPVRSSLFDPRHEAAMGHIELARWPEQIIIVSASAALLDQLSTGRAPDLLTTLCLASDRPLLIAPQPDLPAESHRALGLLQQRGARVWSTAADRSLDVQSLRAALETLPPPAARPLHGLRALVTAGPTREAIDPVRFISNRSSGKQGFAVAEALLLAGAEVTLVAGPSSLATSPGIRRVDVQTAAQMLQASLEAAAGADLVVAAAAVADYRVETVAAQKSRAEADTLTLRLVKNPDILASLRAQYPALFLVGFAAETEQLEAHARGKLARKGLDLIAANWVGAGRAFDTDDNALQVYWADGERTISAASKSEVARQLVQIIVERLPLNAPH